MMTDGDDIYGELVSCGGNDERSGFCSGVRVYDGSSWYITVRLSDIPGAEITEMEDEERMISKHGIFIPFREGGLTVTPKKNVLAVFKAELAQVATSKYTHLLTQITGDETYSENRRNGFVRGFVGKMRPAGNRKSKTK